MKRNSHELYAFMLMAIFLSIESTVSAAPQRPTNLRIYKRDDIPKPPDPYDPDKDNLNRHVSARCTADQQAQEAYGWAEAGVLANALHAWKPTSDYQNAMDLYMGTKSSDNSGVAWSYRQRVQNAVNNNMAAHDGTLQPNIPDPYYWFYTCCDEQDSYYKDDIICNGFVAAYTYEQNRIYWRNITTLLCPNHYFDDSKMPTLSSQLQKIRDDPSKATVMNNLYWNKGHCYFHESFHWSPITNPPATDSDPDVPDVRVYEPGPIKAKAMEKNTYANSVIADAYAISGLSFLMMQIFELKDPPQPGNKTTSGGGPQVNFTTLNEIPSDFNHPGMPVDNTLAPDPALWLQPQKAQINMALYQPSTTSAVLAAPTQNVNLGILTCGTRTDMDNSDYWRDLDSMNQAVTEFCTDMTKPISNVVFSPNQADIDSGKATDHWTESVADPITWSSAGAQWCEGMFGTIVNDCDTASNGHKLWKQGGTFFRDCITYNMTV